MNFFTQKFKEEFFREYEKLIKVPSPSGYVRYKTEYLTKYLSKYSNNILTTPSGRIYCYIPGKTEQNIFLCAHYDVLGLTCESIKENGCLNFKPEGDFMYQSIENANCSIYTRKKGILSGTVLSNKPSLHENKYTAREHERNDKNMEILLDHVDNMDIPVDSEKSTAKLGVHSGDAISLDPEYTTTKDGFIKTRGHDDQAGTHIICYLLKLLSTSKIIPNPNIVLCFNPCEEKGHPITFPNLNKISPITEVSYNDIAIAVDTILKLKKQKLNETMTYICVKDKINRYYEPLSEHLIKIVEKNKINHQFGLQINFGTEVSMGFLKGLDIISACIGPVINGTHAVERTHQKSLLNTIETIWHLVTNMPYTQK